MGLYHKRVTQGFTLIELVIVIIVLGVLSAVAIPKFVNRSSFEDYVLRDQLISRLRLVQLQNMNADPDEAATENACYWLVVTNGCFYSELSNRSLSGCLEPSSFNACLDDSYNDYGAVSFPSGMLSNNNYRFDLSGLLVSGDTSISIYGDNNLSIIIEDEGFIHEN